MTPYPPKKTFQNPRGSSRTLILALAGNTNQNQLLLKIEEKTYKNGTQLFDSDKKLEEKLSKNGTQLLNRSDREFKILDNFPKKIQTSRNRGLTGSGVKNLEKNGYCWLRWRCVCVRRGGAGGDRIKYMNSILDSD